MCAYSDHIPLPPIDISRFGEPCPSDPEVRQIRQQIEYAEHHLNQDDQEMDLVVEKRNDVIRRRLKDYYAFISPIRKVPFELWSEIFALAIFSLPGCCSLQITYEDITAPVLELSHVCSLWRAAAISTPVLWSNMDVNLADVTRIEKIVHLYLRRSEGSLLQLKLCALDDFDNGIEALTPCGWHVFEMLLEVSNRWSHAAFEFWWELLDDKKIEDKLKTLSWNCEFLQSFNVDFNGDIPENAEDAAQSPRLFQLLKRAPRLQILGLAPLRKWFLLPFAQLQDLASISRVDDVLSCFTMCSNLQKLDLVIINFSRRTLPDTRRIEHTKLRSLTWRLHSSHGPDIHSLLFLPSLTELAFSTPVDYKLQDAPRLCSSIQDFLRTHSKCQLKSLKLGAGFYISDEDLLQMLSLIPTITHLELSSCEFRGFMPPFFKGLTLRIADTGNDSAGILLPRLTNLHISIDERIGYGILWKPIPLQWSNGFPFPHPNDILSMLESRRKSVEDSQGQTSLLESFNLEVYLNRVRDDCSVKDWTTVWFGQKLGSHLKTLATEGLKLKLRISSFKFERNNENDINVVTDEEDHIMF
ncbi:hypothetical protein D9758_013547 [Tetrapyrgos nigripes]|uniref:F-box domain-containing protein n=1 Tax=Tetrapyrgos nigripes TaxID=182062 RepID=A0A8H5FKS0_9AGAR|nr:hypothetical protein D9758_013547 [Tetrapyrgos nigripes]